MGAMTTSEFHRRYQSYKTPDIKAARSEAHRINATGGVDGESVMVVHFPPLGYGLLLAKAAVTILRYMPDLRAANPDIPLDPPAGATDGEEEQHGRDD